MKTNYYVIESEKQIQVVDSRREARDKVRGLENCHYHKVSERVARRIAEKTQWGYLPKDITEMFKAA